MNAQAKKPFGYRDIGDKLDYLNKVGSSTALNRYYEGGSPDDLGAVPSFGNRSATGREVFLKKDGTQTFLYSASDEVIVKSSVPDVEELSECHSITRNCLPLSVSVIAGAKRPWPRHCMIKWRISPKTISVGIKTNELCTTVGRNREIRQNSRR